MNPPTATLVIKPKAQRTTRSTAMVTSMTGILLGPPTGPCWTPRASTRDGGSKELAEDATDDSAVSSTESHLDLSPCGLLGRGWAVVYGSRGRIAPRTRRSSRPGVPVEAIEEDPLV